MLCGREQPNTARQPDPFPTEWSLGAVEDFAEEQDRGWQVLKSEDERTDSRRPGDRAPAVWTAVNSG